MPVPVLQEIVYQLELILVHLEVLEADVDVVGVSYPGVAKLHQLYQPVDFFELVIVILVVNFLEQQIMPQSLVHRVVAQPLLTLPEFVVDLVVVNTVIVLVHLDNVE